MQRDPKTITKAYQEKLAGSAPKSNTLHGHKPVPVSGKFSIKK